MKVINLTHKNAIRSAFSMMELIFVIVIIGIMAAVSIWYLPRTELKQAAETMMTNLKYTKTLAQLDDRYFAMGDEKYFDNAPKKAEAQVQNWHLGMWQFQFHSTKAGTNTAHTYSIYVDEANTTGGFDGMPNNSAKIARDPMTKECISGYSGTNLRDCDDKFAKEARFYDTFQTELESIQSDDCPWRSNQGFSIYFDSKGLPYCKIGNNANEPTRLTKPITIKLKRKKESAYICITKGGIVDYGNLLDKNGNPLKDKEGRNRGIPVEKGDICRDI